VARFTILECSEPACALRFPAVEHDRSPARCPLCGGALVVVAQGQSDPEPAIGHAFAQPPAGLTPPLDLIVDNVRSAFNVGSILRSADGAGVRRVYLCGITPTPEHPRVARSALGAEVSMAWRHERNAMHLAQRLRAEGVRLWALEETTGALPLQEVRPPTPDEAPAGWALIAGSEVAGVDPALLDLCERVVCLPMRGRKRSLNVAVAAGIALNVIAMLCDDS
jgi:tRNA G18 (ribose-2'-O)-methylase SpoU